VVLLRRLRRRVLGRCRLLLLLVVGVAPAPATAPVRGRSSGACRCVRCGRV
jgi:hypothetical protein